MDIDFLKSSSEDQMEMMLMQMEKLPDFSAAPYGGDDSQIPAAMMDFVNQCNSNNIIDTYDDGSTSFIYVPPPHTSSFCPSSGSGGVHPPFVGGFSGSGGVHPPFVGGLRGWKPDEGQKKSSMAAMREMIFRIAAMQPIHIDPETVKPPKRRNVRISTDPQSVAARHRRERISERIRILQRLVPGGTKMDTASMLDEAIHYVKFLKNQVQSLERVAANRPAAAAGMGFPVPMTSGSYFSVGGKGYHHHQGIISPTSRMLNEQ